MELRQIKHVMAVAETGSFTKASERVCISQPALSASIAKLEAELDVQLFDRRRSRVVPTPAGVRFLEGAATILVQCNSVRAEVRKAAAPQPLRVGVLRTLPSKVVANLLSSFRRHHPDASVSLFDGSRADLSKRLAERRLHLAITTEDPTDAKEVNSRPLFEDRFVLIVPLGHRFADESSVPLSVIHGEPFISRSSCETYNATAKELVDRSIKPRVAYSTDQDDRALSLVGAGVGVAMFPELFEASGVKQIPFSDFEITRTIAVQWLSPTDKETQHDLMDPFVKIVSTHDWKARW